MPIPAHLQSTVDEYQRLLGVKGNTYMGYIDGEHQYRQYLAAQELVTHHGGEGGDLTFDYPNNKHGQEEIAKRLFNAIVNLEEPQDHFAETGDFAKSLGVKAVKNLTSIEVELLALRFKVSTISPPPRLTSGANLNVFKERDSQVPEGRTRGYAGIPRQARGKLHDQTQRGGEGAECKSKPL